MSPTRARTIANGLLIAGAATAACCIVSRPRARRAIWNLSRAYLSMLPVLVRRQVGTAWMESGRRS